MYQKSTGTRRFTFPSFFSIVTCSYSHSARHHLDLPKITCSLQVLDSIQIFQELTEDYALFLSVFDNGIVAVGSRFGRIGFLHFPVDAILWQHSLPTSSIHSAPQCIDLLQEKDKRGNTIMPRGSERLVSLDLAVVPLDWPLPTENTLRKKFQVTLWVGIEIVSGSIANTTQGYTCLLGWTRVAAVSFPDPYLPTYTDPCTALPSALLLHWYEGNLPNRSRPTPASQPHGPAFFSVAKSGDFSKYPEEHSQDRFFYRYSTAAECREKDCIIGPSYDSVDHNALRPLHLSWLEDSEIISSWYWELENKFPGEDYFLVIATTAGRLYRVSLAYLRYNHVEELEKGEDDTQITRDNFMYRDATKLNACLPVFLHACGTVVSNAFPFFFLSFFPNLLFCRTYFLTLIFDCVSGIQLIILSQYFGVIYIVCFPLLC